MCNCKPKYKSEWEKEKDAVWFNTMSRSQFFLWLDNNPVGTKYYFPKSRKLRCCGIKKIHYFEQLYKTQISMMNNHTGSYWWKIDFDNNNDAKNYESWHINIHHVQPHEEKLFADMHDIFNELENIRYHRELLKQAKKLSPHKADEYITQLNNKIDTDILITREYIINLLDEIEGDRHLTKLWNQFLNDSVEVRRLIEEIEERAVQELLKELGIDEPRESSESTSLPKIQEATIY